MTVQELCNYLYECAGGVDMDVQIRTYIPRCMEPVYHGIMTVEAAFVDGEPCVVIEMEE